MSDDYSMGAALDLAGKFREVADATNQGAERAGGDIKGRVGNMAQKKAAHINADKAKIEAARSGIEMRTIATERNFAMLKRGLSITQAIVGGVVSGTSDRASNSDRADAAVQNGAAAQRRLGSGGDHQKGVTGTLDFQAAKADLTTKMAGVSAELETIKTTYEKPGAPKMSFEDQEKRAGLIKQEQTMKQMSEQLDVLTSFRPHLGQVLDVSGNTNKNGNDRSFHADMQGYLKNVGMESNQIEAFKQYDSLQKELNGIGDPDAAAQKRKSFETKGENEGLDGDALTSYVDKEMGKLSVGSQLQSSLDAVGNDQQAVKQMGPAARFVDAKAKLEAMDKNPATTPKERSDQKHEVHKADQAFNKSLEKDFWKGAWGQMVGQLISEGLGGIQEMQQMTVRYAQAQIALSQASDQAGDAAKQASDMELS